MSPLLLFAAASFSLAPGVGDLIDRIVERNVMKRAESKAGNSIVSKMHYQISQTLCNELSAKMSIELANDILKKETNLDEEVMKIISDRKKDKPIEKLDGFKGKVHSTKIDVEKIRAKQIDIFLKKQDEKAGETGDQKKDEEENENEDEGGCGEQFKP